MGPEKNGSSRHHNLVDPFTKSTTDNLSDIQDITNPIKDNLWTEAWVKTKWTVKALMNMCKECHREYSFCTVFDEIQDVVIILAEKGLTVLELECQWEVHPSIPQNCVPPVSWQSVCAYCPEQYLPHKKETCLQKMIETELQTLQQKQVRITELLCLHNTIQNVPYPD